MHQKVLKMNIRPSYNSENTVDHPIEPLNSSTMAQNEKCQKRGKKRETHRRCIFFSSIVLLCRHQGEKQRGRSERKAQ